MNSKIQTTWKLYHCIGSKEKPMYGWRLTNRSILQRVRISTGRVCNQHGLPFLVLKAISMAEEYISYEYCTILRTSLTKKTLEDYNSVQMFPYQNSHFIGKICVSWFFMKSLWNQICSIILWPNHIARNLEEKNYIFVEVIFLDPCKKQASSSNYSITAALLSI